MYGSGDFEPLHSGSLAHVGFSHTLVLGFREDADVDSWGRPNLQARRQSLGTSHHKHDSEISPCLACDLTWGLRPR